MFGRAAINPSRVRMKALSGYRASSVSVDEFVLGARTQMEVAADSRTLSPQLESTEAIWLRASRRGRRSGEEEIHTDGRGRAWAFRPLRHPPNAAPHERKCRPSQSVIVTPTGPGEQDELNGYGQPVAGHGGGGGGAGGLYVNVQTLEKAPPFGYVGK